MKRISLLLTLSLCLPLAARADDASRHAKAEQLVTLLHTDRMVNSISDSLRAQFAAQGSKAIGTNPTEDSKAKFADAQKKFTDALDAQVSWKVLGPAFSDVYAKAFTEEQLDGIIAFYKSPAGVAFLENTPAVNGQIKQITSPRLDALQAQMRQALDELRKSQTAIPLAPR
jgi:uncharacterized protein